MLRHTYNHHNFLDAFQLTTTATAAPATAWFLCLGLLLSMAALFLYASHHAFLLEQAMKLPHEHENENQDNHEEDAEAEEEAQEVERPLPPPPQQPSQAVSSSCRAAGPPLPRRVTTACNMSLPLSAVPAF
jgi:hypothetical protein